MTLSRKSFGNDYFDTTKVVSWIPVALGKELSMEGREL
jgi:hypothetical protein